VTVFTDLVGQEQVAAILADAVAAAAGVVGGEPGVGMTHAWLFTGPPGSGRSVAARAFAAGLLCPRRGCGDCHDCRTALGATHADLELVRPEGLSIGVKEARQLVLRSTLAPVGHRWRITLIEDADRLTEGAANVLLKAIEEPPARNVWLLCAPAADDLPPTIRSRCRLVRLRIPTADAVAGTLRDRDGVDAALAGFAARAAQGHVGRARRLATDEEARRRRREALGVPTELSSVGACMVAASNLEEATKDEAAAVTEPLDAAESTAFREALGIGKKAPRGSAGALKDLEARQRSRGTRSQRDALDRALGDLAAFYRDVLVEQLGANVPLICADVSDAVSRVARSSSAESTLRRLSAVLDCGAAVDANVNTLLALEAMMLSLHTG
jgi:DNA polymerase-3 subunit delta'